MEEISLESVSVRYANYPALSNISFTIPKGQFVSIIGPTGCGKTSVLNLIAGLLRPTAGVVRFSGTKIDALNRAAVYMFQSDALLPWKTVRDNILIGPLLAQIPRAKAEDEARIWIERVGLTGCEDRNPSQLSGGQRKRVAMAQALINRRPILLMDEAFTALDVQTRAVMETELLRLWEGSGSTVFLVTHDLEEAIAMSDRILLFGRGPEARLKADYAVNIPRPRNVAEARFAPGFDRLYQEIWNNLKEEVMPMYAR